MATLGGMIEGIELPDQVAQAEFDEIRVPNGGFRGDAAVLYLLLKKALRSNGSVRIEAGDVEADEWWLNITEIAGNRKQERFKKHVSKLAQKADIFDHEGNRLPYFSPTLGSLLQTLKFLVDLSI